MLPRIALQFLKDWRVNPDRKPLFIGGARHVGKTTLVHEFAAGFKNYLYFNLESHADHSVFADNSHSIDNLIQALFLQRDMALDSSDTLLFIDEVQESVATVVQLQYIASTHPGLYIIAASSFLQFALSQVDADSLENFDLLELQPLSFHEYLLAKGQMGILGAFLQIPAPAYSHERLMEAFNVYAAVGGMPEIVKTFLSNQDYTQLASIYDRLLNTFRDDIFKYARNSTCVAVMRHVIQSAPVHAIQRIKFERFANSTFRSREIADAMRSLEYAGILRLVYPTTSTALPCPPDRKRSPRLQFLDTGLMVYATGQQQALLGVKDLTVTTNSHIVQHITAQELIGLSSVTRDGPGFWVRGQAGSVAAIDLVFQHEDLLIPIEVKSVKPGRLRSLHQFIDECPHNFAVRIYSGPLSVQAVSTIRGKSYTLLNLPYYLAGRIPEYVKWMVER